MLRSPWEDGHLTILCSGDHGNTEGGKTDEQHSEEICPSVQGRQISSIPGKSIHLFR